MGEIVAAAVVGHQPTIMLPEDRRRALAGGADTTLVAGLAEIDRRLAGLDVDTVVIVDTHWFTTTEHVLAGHAHHQGRYTSEEVPRVICDLPFDYAGAPDLAAAVHVASKQAGLRSTNMVSPHAAYHYPTINLVHHLRSAPAVLSVGVCQTARAHNFMAFGAAIAAGVGETDRRVAVLASGGMSHTFWPLDEILDHVSYSPDDLITPEARAFDEAIIALWAAGDHAAVVRRYPEYRAFSPEGYFGHYLTLLGAIGGPECGAPGERLSDYESSMGTGQVHVWFDLDTAKGSS